jgi:hypothetical protein
MATFCLPPQPALSTNNSDNAVFLIELGKKICSFIPPPNAFGVPLPSGFFASFASSRFPRFSITFPGTPEIRGQILSESFFHPGTGPGAAGQVVIDNCRSTEHHDCGSPKERAGRREERANPNDCQEKILSRKNGASHKHHKIKQLQQIKTAVRHQGKTKAVNISLFFLGGFSWEFQRWTSDFFRRFKMKGKTREEFCLTPGNG